MVEQQRERENGERACAAGGIGVAGKKMAGEEGKNENY
jgi:hypothetical protein